MLQLDVKFHELGDALVNVLDERWQRVQKWYIVVHLVKASNLFEVWLVEFSEPLLVPLDNPVE